MTAHSPVAAGDTATCPCGWRRTYSRPTDAHRGASDHRQRPPAVVTAGPVVGKLDPTDRLVVGLLSLLGLWTDTAIGAAYGVDRKTVSWHATVTRARVRDAA